MVLLLHAGFWLCMFILMFMVLAASGMGQPTQILPTRLLLLAINFVLIPAAVGFYGAYFFIFPRFLTPRRWLPMLGWSGLVAIFAAAVGAVSCTIVIQHDILFLGGFESFITEVATMAVVAVVSGIVGLVLRGFVSWADDVKVREQLQAKTHQMELALVKAQLDPHFLFNTINNVDVLIDTEPAKASEYLNKLSSILRFMLFETKPDRIPLDTELDYIAQYIALQKIRTSNESYVKFSVTGNTSRVSVAPMLFIPFIENAFKHTPNKKLENAIEIAITVEGNKLMFACQNKPGDSTAQSANESGLGNELIQKRLDLLYPEAHTLAAGMQKDVYSVSLIISLNDH